MSEEIGETVLLFVYGTLKRGHCNHHWLEGQQHVGDAVSAPIYRMHDLGGFPGLVLATDGGGIGIHGEVWEVDRDCVRRLDVLEGVDAGEYELVPAALLPPWDDRNVLTYLWLGALMESPDAGSRWTRDRETVP
jgi:gamma-glutamylaminecyclotransferase